MSTPLTRILASRIWPVFGLTPILVLAAQAQPNACNSTGALKSATIALPAHPFAVRETQDGCWVFVSLLSNPAGKNAGLAVLKREASGALALDHVFPLTSRPAGMALTHDGKLLIAAALDKLLFFDVQKLIAGSGDPIAGSFRDGPQESSIYVNVSPDDKLLFASEERSQSITVIDLDRARRNGFNASAVLGTIPTGQKPIALTFSFDGKWLYTTSQVARPEWNWPKACKKEGEDAKSGQPKMVNPEGAVVVVDVERARSAPKESVAARIPAGCSPVRLALSPKGDRLYVTARNSNAVLAFDAAQLLSDGEHARLGMTPVGEAPVSLVVVEDGRRVVVGNSNRFGHSHSEQSLTVLDTAKMEAGGGSGAEVNEIPAGAFPREMIVSADGKALLWTNFGSDSLQVLSEAQLAKALSGQR